ncbi:TPA: hypothetical protein JG832_002501 [Enterobacter hormaechei subsp. xiangfangensis]|nr:hypothetical protein [Enterobacter hormaechei subsp. xiangfangensis]HAV1890636.1 hypothetical protein [Enterobacter hormaechei subsp. xiangfangensis]
MFIAVFPEIGEDPLTTLLDLEQFITVANRYAIDLMVASAVSMLARHLFYGEQCFTGPGQPATYREILLHAHQLYDELNQRRLSHETSMRSLSDPDTPATTP